jgi:hypothetical protein
MIYIPIAREVAESFSESLFKLAIPSHLRSPSTVTSKYCDVIHHDDVNQFSLLVMPENVTLPIHVAADPSELIALLNQFVIDEKITQQELDDIIAALQTLSGQRFNPAQLIPESWLPYVMTREQAELAGYVV